jgi:hypothetical protein
MNNSTRLGLSFTRPLNTLGPPQNTTRVVAEEKPDRYYLSAQNIRPVSIQPTSPNISYELLQNSLKPNQTDDVVTGLISRYKEQIFAAAKRHDIAPEVIATILFDEARQRSWEDDWQDSSVRDLLNKVTDANGVLRDPRSTLLSVFGKNVASNVTLGLTQMSVQGVINLSRQGYLDQIIQRVNFETAPELNSLKLLMNEKLAPFLVAAWCAYVIDSQSGVKVVLALLTLIFVYLTTQIYTLYS